MEERPVKIAHFRKANEVIAVFRRGVAKAKHHIAILCRDGDVVAVFVFFGSFGWAGLGPRLSGHFGFSRATLECAKSPHTKDEQKGEGKRCKALSG